MSLKIKTLIMGMSLLSVVSSQCTEDAQCSPDFYCEKRANHCRECLRCEHLKREAPRPPPTDGCVKSVLQCGPCLAGLVEDLRLDRTCMPSTSQSDEAMPTYAWAIIGLIALGVFLVIIILIVLKKDTIFQHILKIRATTSGCNVTNPSAPEMPPPPYEAYAPVRGASPTHTLSRDEEMAWPFIKRAPSMRAGGVRESASSEAAQPYNNPAYVRGPPSSLTSSDKSEPGSPFPPHDEETMESMWTPSESNNNVPNTADVAIPSAVEVVPARRTRRSDSAGPPAKTLCRREDNNNHGGENGAGPASSGEAGPSYVFNIVTNISTHEQRNSLHLPKH